MRPVFSILLVLPVVVFCCDTTTHYLKDGECCKMCGPGKRMKQDTNCHDPYCQDCNDGEYQSGYTKETKCQLQPICDTNLDFERPSQRSKTTYQPCMCRSGYHCSAQDCYSCVPNTVCRPGQKIATEGNKRIDTTCEACPSGKFSSEHSAKACQQWTECASGYVEAAPGNYTSDRICEAQPNIRLGVGIAVGLAIVMILAVGFCFYKKSRTGSLCLQKKVVTIDDKPTVFMQPEDEQKSNIPEENTHDPSRQDELLNYGVSANGLPVDQDHSKIYLLSQSETLPSEKSQSDFL